MSVPPKKKLSGSQNLKRKKLRELENEKDATQLAKFVKTVQRTDISLTVDESLNMENEIIKEANEVTNVLSERSEQLSLEKGDCTKVDNFVISEDISKWPLCMSKKVIDEIVIRGPKSGKLSENNYSKNEKGRHFCNTHFHRYISNGEVYERKWLIFSESTQKIYCFCCVLFNRNSLSRLGNVGFDDWTHISSMLKSHETSAEHQSALSTWLEATKRLKSKTGIDKNLLTQIENEKSRWRAVLERIISVTFFLAEHNLAFRGSSDVLNTPNNGNFLGLMQLLGKFDPVMTEHLRRIENKEIKTTYFSKNIQNELIDLIGTTVRDKIISKILNSKYFSIILDCTPDVSHTEQMSVTFRFFDLEDCRVRECFLAYKPASSSTGMGLTGLFIDEIINKYNLDMENCRGQGYDNGANMVGKYKGVQSRVSNNFPRAVFNPCGCHNLNLLISDAAQSSVKSVSLFGVLQRLFVFFSGSTKRWEGISKHSELLSLKKVCATRWESRVSSLKAVRYQYSEILDALQEQYEQSTDSITASEARSLAKHLEQFEFLLSLIIWYDILFQVNCVSKAMQSETVNLPQATKLLEKCCNFIRDYRSKGYESALTTAKEIAEKAEINPVVEEVRMRRKRRMFEYESADETPHDPEKLFKINIFYPLIDTIFNSLDTRFEQLSKFNEIWSFLYDLKQNFEDFKLKSLCLKLEQELTHNQSRDISGLQLSNEILCLRRFLDDDQGEPQVVLKILYENSWQDTFPNTWTALRILQTIPVTVANGERSFSKLKLIKTYLRSTMLDEKLSDLAIISIENEIAQSLNYTDLIENFASAKARKVDFI